MFSWTGILTLLAACMLVLSGWVTVNHATLRQSNRRCWVWVVFKSTDRSNKEMMASETLILEHDIQLISILWNCNLKMHQKRLIIYGHLSHWLYTINHFIKQFPKQHGIQSFTSSCLRVIVTCYNRTNLHIWCSI